MIIFSRAINICLVIWCLFLISACSTVVYKKEVDLFSEGVKNATDIFETLRQESLAIDQQYLDNDLKNKLEPIFVSENCYDIVEELQKQSHCFSEWARYRTGERQKPNWCSEPAGCYELPAARAKACIIGPRNNARQIDAALFKAKPMYEKSSAMAGKLSEYSTALLEIVDSKDIDELKSATVEAQTAITGVANQYKDLTGNEIAGIGPITDLITTAAVTAMEAQRFDAMKAIVNKADPLITVAAERLSINTMPLLLKTRIKPAMEKLQKTSEEFSPELIVTGNYSSNLKAINEAHIEYMRYFKDDPSSLFKAMAKAHTVLKDALNDPNTQVATMQSAIKIFSEKAKVAHDAFKK